ncbi:hypothetical protein CORC01_02033 [Colletotrichum orchidophilum]|uniref:Vacuolar ATPase assembly protein VMA22 n=1 Tax=Colletotrichum orchidophilum TaxID=1209926 RepID=A0A1G4BMV8_9PEZI|nr:uncharacterized protein CORC01_02033 [Colletotrichum orchidophilum]OHF02637.1 hypothetical protein CORC01_02033 [Colletotrichum orchidophilum]
METERIDSLLERYLILLDEYTTLRGRLSGTQAGMYQNIARANFSAERGVRYGPDYYDERMQASRTLSLSADDRGVARFEVIKLADDAVTEPMAEMKATEAVKDGASAAAATADGDANAAPGTKPEGVASVDEVQANGQAEREETEREKEKKTKKKSNDPLRWFGILAPMPLRQAQTLSVQAVQDIIPRLVSVDAEMKDIEIEVRRAKKRRAKAETAAAAAAAALKRSDGDETGGIVRHEPHAVVAVDST